MTIPNRLPAVKAFADYHDITYATEDANDSPHRKKRVKCKEVAFDGDYWGLFYTGRLPLRGRIKKMLLRAGCSDPTLSK